MLEEQYMSALLFRFLGIAWCVDIADDTVQRTEHSYTVGGISTSTAHQTVIFREIHDRTRVLRTQANPHVQTPSACRRRYLRQTSGECYCIEL